MNSLVVLFLAGTVMQPLRPCPWLSLFDGRSFRGWASADGGPVGKGWIIQDGCIRRISTGAMDIVTRRRFRDFELELEWKLQPGTNSGVKYRLHRVADGRWIGPEYQIMDDPDPSAPPHSGSCAALYSIMEPRADVRQRPPGSWNVARIVAIGPRIEHWLNGQMVVSIDQTSPEWMERLAASKFAAFDGYSTWFGRQAGPVLLQDHGGSIWFRNIRLREWRIPQARGR